MPCTGLGHAHPRVAHGELQVGACGKGERAEQGGVLQLDTLQLHGEDAAGLLHGVEGVGAEVHDHLVDLSGIGHGGAGVADLLTDLDGGGEGGAQELDGLLQG